MRFEFNKKEIAKNYIKRLKLVNISRILVLFIILGVVSSFGKLEDIYIKIGIYGSFSLLVIMSILHIKLSYCPFCGFQLFNPGRRLELGYIPDKCPKCGAIFNVD